MNNRKNVSSEQNKVVMLFSFIKLLLGIGPNSKTCTIDFYGLEPMPLRLTMKLKGGPKIFLAVKQNILYQNLSFCMCSYHMYCVGIQIWRRMLLQRLVRCVVEIAIAKHAYVWTYLLRLVSPFLTSHEMVVFSVDFLFLVMN